MASQAFGEFLVSNGLLSKDGLRRALEAQGTLECRLGSVVLDLGLISESRLLNSLSRYCSARPASARDLTDIPPEVIERVPARFAVRHQLVPFRLSGRTLFVASNNPRDLLVEDELGQLTGCMISGFVANEVRIEQALNACYGKELSVQMASLLKRLPGAAAEDSSDGDSDPVAAADALTEMVEVGQEKQTRKTVEYRAGAATRRQPDESMAVELSEDELADFPSLRKSLEDTDAGAVPSEPREQRPPQAPPLAPPSAGGPAEPAVAASDVGDETHPHGSPEEEHESDASTGPVDAVEERLGGVADAMQHAEMREDIADAVLEFCGPYLRRRLLLAVREDVLMGWRGEGQGIDPLWVRSMAIPVDEPSVFVTLSMGKEYWRGSLPQTPANQELLLGLGGEEPAECLILPICVRSKPVAFLYGDNASEPLDDLPLVPLRRLAVKAGLALEVSILRNKIRTV